MNTSETTLNTLITPHIAKTYLGNVAETLNNLIIPNLEGNAKARAIDCLRIVSRLVSDAHLSEESHAALNNTNEMKALAEGLAIEQANTEGEHQLRVFESTEAIAARSFDHLALQSYLKQHDRGGKDMEISSSRLLAGGRSKITALLSQQGANDLPTDFIVRQDWENSVTGKAVSLEFELLCRLFDSGIRVPEPLVFEPSADVCGNAFLIFPKITGVAVSDNFMGLPPTEQPLMELAEQLGRIHNLPPTTVEGLEGVIENNYSPVQLHENLNTYEATITKLDSAPSPLLDATIDWLKQNVDRVTTVPKCLVHGDLGFHNLLVDDNHLSAILDWELTHIGNPAYDLGYLRHAVTDDAQWERFMTHYQAGGGAAIEQDFIDYYCLYTGIWYHQIQLQVRTALCAGLVHDIEMSALAADFGPRVLASISRTLHRVLQQ